MQKPAFPVFLFHIFIRYYKPNVLYGHKSDITAALFIYPKLNLQRGFIWCKSYLRFRLRGSRPGLTAYHGFETVGPLGGS